MTTTALKRIVSAIAAVALLSLAIFFWRNYEQKYPSVVGDVSDFKDTEIVVHPDVPLDPNKNVIWCGTMALAWNEAIRKLGGELHFTAPSREADLLNRQEFTKADLDEESYVIVADSENNRVSDKIRENLKEKFGSAVPARLVPDDSGQDSQKFDIYACLYKSLEFPIPFHENVLLWFDFRQVANFGFGLEPEVSREYSSGDNIVRSQVSVLSYVSDDNFVIRLKTGEDKDQLILAKIAPGKTLQTTIDSVLPAVKADTYWGVGDHDELAIPKLDFDLMKEFTELEGPYLTPSVQIDKIAENIIFKLNETGVKLTSFTTISATLGWAGSNQPPPPPCHFIFNKPFLILLKRESSPRPYFALWVGNPTLLVSP